MEAGRGQSSYSRTLVHDITILLKTHTQAQTKGTLCYIGSICVAGAEMSHSKNSQAKPYTMEAGLRLLWICGPFFQRWYDYRSLAD